MLSRFKRALGIWNKKKPLNETQKKKLNLNNAAERHITKYFDIKSGEEILAEAPENIKGEVRKRLRNRNMLNKTLKRQKGSRNLTRNNNNAAMRFVTERMGYNLTGQEIRNQARNKNQNMRNRINKTLKNIGM